jgi:hypothetical protein
MQTIEEFFVTFWDALSTELIRAEKTGFSA